MLQGGTKAFYDATDRDFVRDVDIWVISRQITLVKLEASEIVLSRYESSDIVHLNGVRIERALRTLTLLEDVNQNALFMGNLVECQAFRL